MKDIDLACCNINDEGIKALKGVRNIHLEYCNKITIDGIKALSKINHITFPGRNWVSREDFQKSKFGKLFEYF